MNPILEKFTAEDLELELLTRAIARTRAKLLQAQIQSQDLTDKLIRQEREKFKMESGIR